MRFVILPLEDCEEDLKSTKGSPMTKRSAHFGIDLDSFHDNDSGGSKCGFMGQVNGQGDGRVAQVP